LLLLCRVVMAGEPVVTAEIAHVFGSHCGTGLRDPAFFSDDAGHHLVHPAGRHIVFRHIDTGETNFLISADRVEGLTACCISRDRAFLAVCERCSGEPYVQVSVYDMAATGSRLKKRLEPLGNSPGRLVGVTFSAESPARFLAVITSGADPTVVIMDWQTDRVIGRCPLHGAIDRVAFAPHDAHQLSVSGPHVLRLPRLKDSKMRDGAPKMLPSFNGIDETAVTFTDHAWVEPGDGTLVASTTEGQVFILSSQDMSIAHTITVPFQDAQGFGAGVPFCVRCFSHGFILGGSEGMVAVWEQVDNPPTAGPGAQPGAGQPKDFRHVRTVRVRQTDSSVCCIDMTGTEESLVLGFRNADIGYMSMASLYIARGSEVECTVFAGGFHSGPITGLDMAVQWPLVVTTCRKDSSLRIWNYSTRQCDLHWEFIGDPPTSVAMHPFGYFIAVSFGDKLRFFQVLVNELKLHREFPLRGVKVVRFSNGGHLVAAAQGKSVHVFAARTVSKVATLQGHAQHVKVLCWDPDDHVLMTCGEDGTLIEWSTQTWEKTSEHRSKDSQYTAVSCSTTGDVYTCSTEGVHCLLQRFKHCQLEQTQEVERGVKLQALCHYTAGTHSMGAVTGAAAMFAGASNGALIVYPSALAMGKYKEYGLHAGSCSMMRLSADGRMLVTTGEDGSIFLLSVTGLAAVEEGSHPTAGAGESEARVAGAEVVLINRGEIQQRQDEFQLLHAENLMLQARLAEEAAKLEAEIESRVREARQRDQAEIRELTRRCDALRQATDMKEKESTRLRDQMERTHAEAADQLKHLYEKKLEHEADRFVDLKAEENRLQEVIKELRAQTDKQLEEERERAEEELERQLAEKDMEIQKHKDLIAFTQHRFNVMLESEGRSHDQEVAEMKVHSYEELQERKRVEADLRREQETLLLGLDHMEKEREKIEKEQHEDGLDIAKMKGQVDELSRTVKNLSGEKRERESTLEEKNQKISEYKVKVNTLKKFRHVLDKELREVTETLQPKDLMIDQRNRHLHELEAEFEKQLVDQRNMEDAIDQKKQQIAFLASENERLKGTITEKDRLIGRFTDDLHGLITNQELDAREWPAEIRKMYHTHVRGEVARQDRLPVEEIQRQMRLMERKTTSLAAKGSQMEAMCKADIQRKAQENAQLVGELNELRVQKKSLQGMIKSKEKELKQLEHNIGEQLQLKGMKGSRLALEDTITSLPPPSTTSPTPPPQGKTLPRTPSGGSLPGPRQRAQSPLEDSAAAARTMPKKLGSMDATAPPSTSEERKRLESLLLTADFNSQEIQMQREENKLLREQIEQLLAERQREQPQERPGSSGSAGRVVVSHERDRAARSGSSRPQGRAAVR